MNSESILNQFFRNHIFILSSLYKLDVLLKFEVPRVPQRFRSWRMEHSHLTLPCCWNYSKQFVQGCTGFKQWADYMLYYFLKFKAQCNLFRCSGSASKYKWSKWYDMWFEERCRETLFPVPLAFTLSPGPPVFRRLCV